MFYVLVKYLLLIDIVLVVCFFENKRNVNNEGGRVTGAGFMDAMTSKKIP